MKYQIEVDLDLGDLGQVRATVDGVVLSARLFGDAAGPYHETKIEKVVAHIPVYPQSAHSTDLDVTFMLSKAAHVSICESLESFHEAQRRGA